MESEPSKLRVGAAPPPVLWDAIDAAARIDASGLALPLRTAAADLIRDGIAILRGVQARALCEQVIADYQQYVAEHAAYVRQNLDVLGREKRLVNFHQYSKAALAIGLNGQVLQLLDYLLGSEVGIYTSLTFKYGTQQPVHRDTPHFVTWPGAHFCGVWTALRDVSPDAGPLFYYRGGHRAPLAPGPFWQMACKRSPQASRTELLALALDLYNGEVIRNAPVWGELVVPEVRAGDVVIWHAETPHGGLPARDTSAPRWSIVFHCAPKALQVHQHDAFFTHTGDQPPPPRYGFRQVERRAVASAGEVAFM